MSLPPTSSTSFTNQHHHLSFIKINILNIVYLLHHIEVHWNIAFQIAQNLNLNRLIGLNLTKKIGNRAYSTVFKRDNQRIYFIKSLQLHTRHLLLKRWINDIGHFVNLCCNYL